MKRDALAKIAPAENSVVRFRETTLKTKFLFERMRRTIMGLVFVERLDEHTTQGIIDRAAWQRLQIEDVRISKALIKIRKTVEKAVLTGKSDVFLSLGAKRQYTELMIRKVIILASAKMDILEKIEIAPYWANTTGFFDTSDHLYLSLTIKTDCLSYLKEGEFHD